MTIKAGWSTPLLVVTDVERSIRFYALLGFELVDVDQGEHGIGWARMHCEGGAVMFLQAEVPLPEDHEGTMLYLYTADLPALRDQLAAAGVEVPPISRPQYMPSGELALRDPDGHRVFVAHWGDAEHEAWLAQLREKRAAGLVP